MGKKKNAGKPPKIQGRGSLCLQTMLLKTLALAAPADTAHRHPPSPPSPPNLTLKRVVRAMGGAM